eukprot:2585192-Amphidinium_carterae.1
MRTSDVCIHMFIDSGMLNGLMDKYIAAKHSLLNLAKWTSVPLKRSVEHMQERQGFRYHYFIFLDYDMYFLRGSFLEFEVDNIAQKQ